MTDASSEDDFCAKDEWWKFAQSSSTVSYLYSIFPDNKKVIDFRGRFDNDSDSITLTTRVNGILLQCEISEVWIIEQHVSDNLSNNDYAEIALDIDALSHFMRLSGLVEESQCILRIQTGDTSVADTFMKRFQDVGIESELLYSDFDGRDAVLSRSDFDMTDDKIDAHDSGLRYVGRMGLFSRAEQKAIRHATYESLLFALMEAFEPLFTVSEDDNGRKYDKYLTTGRRVIVPASAIYTLTCGRIFTQEGSKTGAFPSVYRAQSHPEYGTSAFAMVERFPAVSEFAREVQKGVRIAPHLDVQLERMGVKDTAAALMFEDALFSWSRMERIPKKREAVWALDDYTKMISETYEANGMEYAFESIDAGVPVEDVF